MAAYSLLQLALVSTRAVHLCAETNDVMSCHVLLPPGSAHPVNYMAFVQVSSTKQRKCVNVQGVIVPAISRELRQYTRL